MKPPELPEPGSSSEVWRHVGIVGGVVVATLVVILVLLIEL